MERSVGRRQDIILLKIKGKHTSLLTLAHKLKTVICNWVGRVQCAMLNHPQLLFAKWIDFSVLCALFLFIFGLIIWRIACCSHCLTWNAEKKVSSTQAAHWDYGGWECWHLFRALRHCLFHGKWARHVTTKTFDYNTELCTDKLSLVSMPLVQVSRISHPIKAIYRVHVSR